MCVPHETRVPKSPLAVTWTHWARTQQSIKSLVYPKASKLLQNLLIEARSRLTNGCKEHLTSFYWGGQGISLPNFSIFLKWHEFQVRQLYWYISWDGLNNSGGCENTQIFALSSNTYFSVCKSISFHLKMWKVFTFTPWLLFCPNSSLGN